jgi:hypothetical protein
MMLDGGRFDAAAIAAAADAAVDDTTTDSADEWHDAAAPLLFAGDGGAADTVSDGAVLVAVHRFDAGVDAAAEVLALQLSAVDGALVYVNGQLAAAVNVDGTDASCATSPLVPSPTLFEGTDTGVVPLPGSLLVAGSTNTVVLVAFVAPRLWGPPPSWAAGVVVDAQLLAYAAASDLALWSALESPVAPATLLPEPAPPLDAARGSQCGHCWPGTTGPCRGATGECLPFLDGACPAGTTSCDGTAAGVWSATVDGSGDGSRGEQAPDRSNPVNATLETCSERVCAASTTGVCRSLISGVCSGMGASSSCPAYSTSCAPLSTQSIAPNVPNLVLLSVACPGVDVASLSLSRVASLTRAVSHAVLLPREAIAVVHLRDASDGSTVSLQLAVSPDGLTATDAHQQRDRAATPFIAKALEAYAGSKEFAAAVGATAACRVITSPGVRSAAASRDGTRAASAQTRDLPTYAVAGVGAACAAVLASAIVMGVWLVKRRRVSGSDAVKPKQQHLSVVQPIVGTPVSTAPKAASTGKPRMAKEGTLRYTNSGLHLVTIMIRR